jgi:hypothetical protein
MFGGESNIIRHLVRSKRSHVEFIRKTRNTRKISAGKHCDVALA